MGTEVIQPQDCLVKKIKVPRIVYPCKNYKHKSNQNGGTSNSPRFATRSPTSKCLVMGHFTLIRRGENIDSIDEINPNENDYVFTMNDGTTNRREVLEDLCSKRFVANDCTAMYAGTSCAVSPSPECLPLPSFSKKAEVATVDGTATKDLRRLLKLDENLDGNLQH